MAIGKQIRHYRKKLGWQLKKLSEASGVDIGTISALENRDSKSSEYFLFIANALGLTLEQLADESKDWPIDLNRQGAPTIAAPVARESAPSFGWPFHDITPERYNTLTPDQKRSIENMVLTLLQASDPATKQSEPEKIASSDPTARPVWR